MARRIGDRHLVRAECPLHRQAVDHLRSRPSLRRIEDDHRPARSNEVSVRAGALLDAPDLLDDGVERRGHRLVHQRGIVSLDEVGRPAVAAQQLFQLLTGDPRENGRVGDLVAVEMQDRQHRAVGDGIEKLVGVPGRRQRPGLRLAVADDAGDDEIGIVEHGAERVTERIAELAALVDRTRTFRRRVAGDPARKRELQEQPSQPRFVLADVRDRSRCRCPRDRCWPRPPARRAPGRRRRSCRGRTS